MAGPSIMVRVLGDLTGLGSSFTGAQTKGTSAAAGMKTAFSSMLGTLNNTGALGPFGNTISQMQQSLGGMGTSMKSTSDKLVGLGAAGLTAGIILQKAGSADQAAHQQLQAAVTATGRNYDQYAGKVDAAIKHQENFGNSAVQTQNALQTLTQITGNPTKALQLLSTASDLAAAKHISLSEAANTVGKAYEGNTKVLKQFGITVTTTGTAQQQLTKDTTAANKADTALTAAKRSLYEMQVADASAKSMTASMALKLQDAQAKVTTATDTATVAHQKLSAAQQNVAKGGAANAAAMTQLSQKLSGQAAASVNTFSGHMDVLKTKIEDQTATLGQKYGPALTKVGAALTGLGGVMKVAQAAQDAMKDSTIAATIAQDAAKVSTMAGSVATGIATAATWLWNLALEANPIVLIATLIGVVLVGAIVLIVTHFNDFKKVILDVWNTAVTGFDAIKNAILVVYNWVAANWPLLLAILTGPIGLAVLAIESNWGTLVSFFTGIPAKIASALSGMWDFIGNEFRSVINHLIDGWNSLKFTTPSIDVFGLHTPSVTLGVPAIPHLAQGGLITQSGLVYAHAGEAITPMPSNTFGPAVSIGTQHFHNDLDMDAFMRRAAALIRSQRGGLPVQ
jgi:hypothetical protein